MYDLAFCRQRRYQFETDLEKTEDRCEKIANIENSVNKIKILIVDDDPEIVLTFKTGLESNGFEVDSYNDPFLALKNFKANFYDLLLIDIRMPDMTGFEFYQKINKIDNKAKVCFITAFEVYYRALLENFSDLYQKCFIQKPISIDKLVKRIKTQLDIQNN
jgi:DNA-binding response OmpR family regulator